MDLDGNIPSTLKKNTNQTNSWPSNFFFFFKISFKFPSSISTETNNYGDFFAIIMVVIMEGNITVQCYSCILTINKLEKSKPLGKKMF